MLYQIFTEDTHRERITAILDSHFAGYTLIPAQGHWQGVPEPSVVAEVETDDSKAVTDAAEAIKAANVQQAVLVEAIPTKAELV